MHRATKIVATIGPASSDLEMLDPNDSRRRRRRAPEFFARHGARSHRPRRPGARSCRSSAAAKWRSWPICRARKSASANSRTARSQLETRRSLHSRRRLRTGQPGTGRPRLQGIAARRASRRHAAAQRRPDRAGRRVGDRQRDSYHGEDRRRAVEQQGHQPPGRRADRAGADRQGHGRHQDRDAASRRITWRSRFPKSATDMDMARQLANIAGEPAAQAADDRQDRACRSDSALCRKFSTHPTASWWRAATLRWKSAMPRFRPCKNA